MCSGSLEQASKAKEHCVWPMEKVAPADDDDAITQRFQKPRPRFGLGSRSCDIDHQRALRTEMVDDERSDLAIADELIVTQTSRAQELRECVICGVRGAIAHEQFGLGAISQHTGEHAAEDRQYRSRACRELMGERRESRDPLRITS